MSLSVDDLRLHVTTSLTDPALQQLLDAADEAITEILGPVGPTTERFRPSGASLMLSQRAAEVTTVLEYAHLATPTTLAADDYELSASGFMLRRLTGGTTGSTVWRPVVAVTYAPFVDTARREAAQIALVELELNTSPGAVSERIGDWSETQSQAPDDYQATRASILASLRPDPVVVY